MSASTSTTASTSKSLAAGAARRRARFTPGRLALLLVALAVVAAWQVTVIPESMIQMAVGPVLVPGVVVAMLVVLALAYGWSAWRGRQVDDAQIEDHEPLPGGDRRLLFLLGGGVLFMALVQPLGFIIPAALCGMGVARAFDAPVIGRSAWRSGLICLGIAAFFWFVLAYLLGVGLGPALSWPWTDLATDAVAA
ncbi:hypothetical protein AZ34_03560 [Hylemonella gracilis str. Niagara R]|uniref:DUF1468 domain-containing protein n=1 Tax=Hylemonella gracilis str. Niagara R TaxID=1458275 RepID=A0A016XF92_9BURK|nr:tripartite tricarboxylate transporter TctB family protein [Hylemonella gracilis]EYC50242.1 hypothetical protein AZ34_03560 [Hylemonella gracilis str. Niagara R]